MFHAARNLQGEGVDVAVVRIELEKYEAGRRGRGWINGGQAILRFGLERGKVNIFIWIENGKFIIATKRLYVFSLFG